MINKKYLLLILIFQFACIMDIEENNTISMIKNFHAEYDQNSNKLFLQLITDIDNQLIEFVEVKMNKNDNQFTEIIFSLNDNGESGDLIPSNGTFSLVHSFDELLSFGDYELDAIVQSFSGEKNSIKINLNIEEQFLPEIVQIKFWKKNKFGQGFQFDPQETEFQVNDYDSSYLDIQIEIKDKNGKDDIEFIRYQVNVADMTSEDSCNYVPEEGFQSYSQWFLEFHSETDSSFIYDINNHLLPEPGIPIKPMNSCGSTGVSIFRFIISDYFYDSFAVEVPLIFIQCGENLWDCQFEGESNYCIEECGE